MTGRLALIRAWAVLAAAAIAALLLAAGCAGSPSHAVPRPSPNPPPAVPAMTAARALG